MVVANHTRFVYIPKCLPRIHSFGELNSHARTTGDDDDDRLLLFWFFGWQMAIEKMLCLA